ncbi:MAG: hypothetical protein ACR2PI_11925 [Hyphomicrobiaceae bacterium]
MRNHAIKLIALTLPVALAACGGAPSDTAPINVNQVLERTVKTLVNFDAYLRRYDYKTVDSAMFGQFNKTIQHDLNAAPPFHPTKIATRLNKDASITGYGDLNKNGKADPQEPKLFKIELDTDNDRIIVTSAAQGYATGRTMGRSGGFFAGVMIGGLMNRQTNAGVRRGHFDSRRVANAPITRRVASRGSSARGRARSGGIRAGK